MQITVLGKSPAWQDREGACSSYLVREGGFSLLIDCGSGAFAKLRRFVDYRRLDAVLISHLHADHILDLVPFSYGLMYSPRSAQAHLLAPAAAGANGTRPALWAPPGALDTFRHLTGSWGAESLIEDAFVAREYEPDGTLDLGPLRVWFCEVPHYTRCFAIELGAATGVRFTFGADCAPNDGIVEFASGTDLLFLEATLMAPESGPLRGHMTAREAGEHARRAHARRLVLTHFSDELDAGWVRDEAVAGFGSPVDLAREGAEFTV